MSKSENARKYKNQSHTGVSGNFNLERLFLQGMTQHKSGHLEKAKATYQQVLLLKPNHVHALHFLGVIAHLRKNHSLAVELIDKAIALKPNYAQAFSNRGVALQLLNKLEDAIESYDKAIELNPEFADVFSNRGIALQLLNKLEDAIESYDKAIALKPDFADAFSNRGIAFKELHKYLQAADNFAVAIRLEPSSIKFFLLCGLTNFLLGKRSHAERVLSKCIALTAKNSEDVSRVAVAQLRLGRWKDAFDLSRDVCPSVPSKFHDGLDSPDITKMYLKRLPALKFMSSKVWKPGRTVMFAADEVYIQKFFKNALESVEKTNPDLKVHLHAMISSESQVPALYALVKDNVSVSWEVYKPDRKSGYTTRRFVRLRQLLTLLRQPIICLDIDCKVMGRLDGLFDTFSDEDIGIYRRDFELVINQLIHAAIFLASPTSPALRFLDFFINYLEYLEGADRHNWFADQMALLASDQWVMRNPGTVRVKQFEEKLMSWTVPTKECLIYTFNGVQKNTLSHIASS